MVHTFLFLHTYRSPNIRHTWESDVLGGCPYIVNYCNRMVVDIFILLQDPAALGNSSENLEHFTVAFGSKNNCHYGFE